VSRAAVVVEPGEDAHQRVVRRLERDVVELVAAEVRKHRPAAGNLEPCGAEQKRVHAFDRCLPVGAVAPQRGEPPARILLGLGRGLEVWRDLSSGGRHLSDASGARMRTAS
jgi:hypothetical protein